LTELLAALCGDGAASQRQLVRGQFALRHQKLQTVFQQQLELGWIKCMLGLAAMSVRKKSARKKKRKPKVDATVYVRGSLRFS
jgi:hypothetical protein